MSFFNQYSVLFFGLGALVLIVLLLRRWIHARWRTVLAVEAVVLAVFVAIFLTLRPGAGDVNTVAAADALLQNNRPTFVELFSNFCTGCLLVRPAVDQVVEQIDDEFNIMRINIHSPAGRELSEKFNFTFSPEFILFDADGTEVWRSNSPPLEAQLALARQP